MKKTNKKEVVNTFLHSDSDDIRSAIIDGALIYIRKNGNVIKAKLEDAEFLSNNKIYRVWCVEDGTVIYDFDAYDARPQFKDLLARAGQFLEVKLLYVCIMFLFVHILLSTMIFFSTPSLKEIQEKIDAMPKSSIINGQIQTTNPQQKQNIADILSNQGI